jgi:hypothetical protein
MVDDDRAITIKKDPGPRMRVPYPMVTVGHAIFTVPPRIVAA